MADNMSDNQQHEDDPGLEAPPGLVAALRRLQPAAVRVPPQFDEAALSRPRLHLSRIKRWQEDSPETRAAADEDLALAGRTETRGKDWPGRFKSSGNAHFLIRWTLSV